MFIARVYGREFVGQTKDDVIDLVFEYEDNCGEGDECYVPFEIEEVE
jgi:hypothetical protein